MAKRNNLTAKIMAGIVFFPLFVLTIRYIYANYPQERVCTCCPKHMIDDKVSYSMKLLKQQNDKLDKILIKLESLEGK